MKNAGQYSGLDGYRAWRREPVDIFRMELKYIRKHPLDSILKIEDIELGGVWGFIHIKANIPQRKCTYLLRDVDGSILAEKSFGENDYQEICEWIDQVIYVLKKPSTKFLNMRGLPPEWEKKTSSDFR